MIKTIFVFCCLLVGCEQNTPQPQSSSEPLKIVTSFSVLQDLVQQVCKHHCNVQTIVKNSQDPHTYQPTPQDAKLLQIADLIIINGLGFEGWIERLIQAASLQEMIVATKYVRPRIFDFALNGTPIVDPHAWHDVQNAILYIQAITEALCQKAPHHKEFFKKNEKAIIEKLQLLDQWVKKQFETIPLSKRLVITTHDAFWYYGKAYGITFLSPVGISTEAQPSATHMAQLIEDIHKKNIRAIFIENLSNRKLVEQIAQEAGIPIDGVLFADSLSDKNASTYIDMIRHNTQTIKKGLLS
ncbi:MAG: zinc ABC transporter substrate-binding protein [Proteobacteria bacterium]|nr:zinc ABC transporter substrate-binding protein [Pseudomonadota bacterium]